MIDLGINLFQEIAALGGGGGYPITNSLRFNDNDSAYLSRTPSVAGNRRTFTWSGWVKRGNVGDTVYGNLFSVRDTSTTRTVLRINADSLDWLDDDVNFRLITSAKLRDTGGWYHIVATADTTQATTSDRLKIYINGVRVSSFSTSSYPSQNYETEINSTRLHALGVEGSTTNDYFDGYMAEVNFIDGQALTADDFGEIDATTGEWSPKAYSGTYGTNGFYLPFNGNANDDSGNGNNWTENNLAPTDYMIDTPTNNFAVLNPLADNFATYSQGNLSIVCGTTGNGWTFSTMALPSTGKWYVEAVWTGTPSDFMGFNSPSLVRVIQTRGQSGQIWADNVLVETVTAWSAGQIVGLQVDCDAGTFQFYRDNVAFGSSHSFTHIDGMSFGAQDGSTAASTSFNMNFGADSSFAGNKTRQGNTDANGIGDFYYTPPTGYLALCTDNLPAPAIEQPETQFNVVTYTGNGGTLDVDVGFQPDFVWTKSRTNAYVHGLWDSIRGVGKHLMSNLANAEVTNDPDGYLSAFNPNGFTLSAGSSSSATWNLSGGSYVAWCWKAGGTAVTNTDGTITSQVSANVDAGFSIVGYTGSGAVGSVGVGLTNPELIIIKDRDASADWYVQTNAIDGSEDYLILNSTASALAAPSGYSLGSNVFNFGGAGSISNLSGRDYIAYCFHSVEGFSKFGSYVGNGSTNGPFVYTGFKVAFVLYKRATGGTGNWILYDNEREGYNGDNPALYPNLSLEEATSGTSIDFLANGFKILNPNTDHNASGSTYIYMAFAEHPFKEALAR